MDENLACFKRSDSSIAVIVVVLFVFVIVSIMAVAYTVQKKIFIEQFITDKTNVISEKEKLRKCSETFSFTERKAEVFSCLVNTEDNVETIAESLYVSRRTLERYISSIYGKTGVKFCVGLLNLYNKYFKYQCLPAIFSRLADFLYILYSLRYLVYKQTKHGNMRGRKAEQ